MNKLQMPQQVLLRKEQREIRGGEFEMELAAAGGTLCCTTPYGTECWSRSKRPSDPWAACDAIYPAYGGVIGYWLNV
jgi:hypothetical protein